MGTLEVSLKVWSALPQKPMEMVSLPGTPTGSSMLSSKGLVETNGDARPGCSWITDERSSPATAIGANRQHDERRWNRQLVRKKIREIP